MKTSNSLSNEALVEEFELSHDHPTIVEILPSAEKGAMRIGLAQLWSNPLSRPKTAAEQLFRRSSPVCLRLWRTVPKAEWKGYGPGTMLDDMVLRVVDSIRKPITQLTPRLTREGTVLVDAHGNPIWREIVPCLLGVDTLQDFVLEAFDSGDQWEPEEEAAVAAEGV